MTDQCRQCQKTFKISESDQEFYERIGVPAPKLCPDCRKQRRLTYKNDFNLHQRKCDLCNKDMISMYDSDSPYKVYCHKCWWSDKWSPMEYGANFNFNRPFFEQFKELQLQVPRVSLINVKCENSEYTNFSDRNKNCYMISTANDNEDCYYGYWLLDNKNCVDCIYARFCENCYELIDCVKCYNTFYSQLCHDCVDCQYLYDCRGCQNCYACVGLRNAEYHIFNRAYTKEAYEAKIQTLYKRVAEKRFAQLKIKTPRKYFTGKNSEHSSGDRIINCADARHCFDVHDLENCAHCFDGLRARDCYDCNNFDGTELCYETFSAIGRKFLFSYYCRDSSGLVYCDNCHSSQELFGCVGLRKRENCILNRQLSASEYKDQKTKIIEHMTRTGEWGEAFPIANSPFAYNETMAHIIYPIKKEKVIGRAWAWKEEKAGEVKTGKNIKQCNSCLKSFRMLAQEKDFYQQNSIKEPKDCFDCRHKRRMKMRNPSSLWHRQCMCTQTDHGHQGRCTNEFETSYSPDGKELVYCEQCYNQEIY